MRILRPAEIQKITGMSKATICRLMSNGTLPKVQLSERTVGVSDDDLNAFLKNARVTPANVE